TCAVFLRSALPRRYHLRLWVTPPARKTVAPPLFDFVASEPRDSASKPAGTTTRTLPESPNAQATNVANADPTRMSLFDRGAPPGRSKVTWIRALSWKNSD